MIQHNIIMGRHHKRPITVSARAEARLEDSLKASREALKAHCPGVAVRSAGLPRIDRERLARSGFLRQVLNGWYTPARPEETDEGKATWRAAYWGFLAVYLRKRFGDDWCLSPEQSLMFHAGNRAVPDELIIRSPVACNKTTELLHGNSLLEVRAAMPRKKDIVDVDGMRLFSLPSALVASQVGFFAQHPVEARAALRQIQNAQDLSKRLLEGGHSTIAGRLAGAFLGIQSARHTMIAGRVVQAMRNAGYNVRATDPFMAGGVVSPTRQKKPARRGR